MKPTNEQINKALAIINELAVFAANHNGLSEQVPELVAVTSWLQNITSDTPYCPGCGSCGHDGCCPAEICIYPGIKEETLAQAKEISESVCNENIRLRKDRKHQDQLIHTLFTKIKHGDQEHQDWLYKAIKEHFNL